MWKNNGLGDSNCMSGSLHRAEDVFLLYYSCAGAL